MKLCFSIDALSASGAKAWRLLENQSWRECIYGEALKDGDARLTDQQNAQKDRKSVGQGKSVDLSGTGSI